MILLVFQQSGIDRLGIKTTHGILDVAAANAVIKIPGLAGEPASFFSTGLEALDGLNDLLNQAMHSKDASAWFLEEESLKLRPCVPQPGKIICAGLNYQKHARESKLEIPQVPVLFSKYSNALASHGEPIPLPPNARKYDYEAELAVVIGRKTRYISEEEALSAVLGYCNANDVSERELQSITSQWMLGKTLDKFFPLGPYLITADEAGDPQNFPVRCWLNGELRQDSSTADMIFPVARLISFISHWMTLESGDVISTGTPEGVILGKPSPRTWMKAGDIMTVEVGPLGKLTNQLVAEV